VTSLAVGLVVLVVGAGGFLLAERHGMRRGRSSGSWGQIHVPALAWLLGAGAAAGADPFLDALLQAGRIPIQDSFDHLWPVLGLPIIAGVLVLAGRLWRRAPEPGRAPWVWVGSAALALLLVLAERVRLLDAQLLMLGGVTLIWWRSATLDHRRAPAEQPGSRGVASSAPLLALLCSLLASAGAAVAAGGSGSASWMLILVLSAITLGLAVALSRADPGWTVLLGICGGVGTAALARIGFVVVLGIAEAQRTATGTWLEVLATSLMASPYLTGLSTYAPEAVLLMVSAGVAILDSSLPANTSARRLLSFVIIGATGLTLAWRLGLV